MKKSIPGFCLFILATFFTTIAYGFQTKPNTTVPLKEVLKTLTEHFQVDFLYEESTVYQKTITFNKTQLKEAKLTQLLDQLLTPLSLSWYKVDNKNYSIFPAANQNKKTKPELNETGLNKASADSTGAGKITGLVFDKQRQAQEFATISLLNAADSTVKASTLSDGSGAYLFSGIKTGNYLIRTDLMGYHPAYSNPFLLSSNTQVNIDPILMEAFSQTLKEVQITASRALIETKGDRLIMNVENSAMASGSSIQFLKTAPFVRVSADNEVSLQGKKTMILIDNKPVPEASLSYILETLPAGNISKVELITSPSAKYDAMYGAVINITTRKNQVEGVTGNVRAEGSSGTYTRGSADGDIAYKNKNLTLFGMAGEQFGKKMFAINAERTLQANGTPDVLTYDMKRIPNNHIYSFQTGAELVLDKNQTIGTLIDGRIYNVDGTWFTLNTFRKQGAPIDSILHTNTTFGLKVRTNNYNLNYHLLSDSGKNELTVLATYTPFSRNLFQYFPSVLTDPSGNTIRTPETYQTTNISAINVYLAQMDYIHSFDQQWKLETGLKFQYSDSRNTIDYQHEKDGQMQNVAAYSSSNHLRESISGAYGILSKDWKNDKLQLGIRVENTKATFIGIYAQDYFNVFPTAMYQHKVNENYNLSFSYKRTISRAPYYELVPYTVFINQYTIEQGNPKLRPEYDDILTLNANIRKLNVSVSYTAARGKANMVPSTQDYDTKVTYFSRQNLDKAYDLSVYAFYPLRLNSWWETQNSATLFGYNKVKGQVLNNPYSLSAFRGDFRSSHIFKVSNIVKLQVDAYYWSPYIEGLTSFSGYKNVDAAVVIALFAGKGQLRIGGNELIFKRNDFTQKNDFGTYASREIVLTDSKRGSIGFTYKLGRTRIKSPDKKLGNEDVLKRF